MAGPQGMAGPGTAIAAVCEQQHSEERKRLWQQSPDLSTAVSKVQRVPGCSLGGERARLDRYWAGMVSTGRSTRLQETFGRGPAALCWHTQGPGGRKPRG